MLFNSFTFGLFLPIVFILHWFLPFRYRWIIMLIASYYFYMSWNVKYVVLILITTGISYSAALLLEKQTKAKNKKIIVIITAILCLGILFFFKYFNFVSESISEILKVFTIQTTPITLKLLLPAGISFYTFQTMSYVIDVYRGEIQAEKHFGYYATFISFFPQLVAGPIERTRNLLPQIKDYHEFDYQQATYGLKLMAWGFFKKIVIADTLSNYVGTVYNAPQKFLGFSFILATFLFTLQIYCDFSGYSDIAIGTAKLFGINLMRNFKSPYFSESIKEFWSRWHISLSTWFRDYIYIPLGGNRVGNVRYIANIMITFLASGLWHGANWTFVVWGTFHGFMQVLGGFIIPKGKRKSAGFIWWLRVLCTFIFVAFSWIFFVSNSMQDALYVITHLFDGISRPIVYLSDGFRDIGITKLELLKQVLLISVLAIYDYYSLEKDVILTISDMNKLIRWTIYVIFVFMIIFLSQKGVAAEFLYFQF